MSMERILQKVNGKNYIIYMRKNTTSNKVFLMKKLNNLKMKEGALVVEHSNKFNIITSQFASIKIILDDKIRAILLLCFTLNRQENLIVAINTSAPARTLKFDDVSSSLMNKELRHKSMEKIQREALAFIDHGKKIDRVCQGYSRSINRLKSKKERIVCFHCGKSGHIKKEH